MESRFMNINRPQVLRLLLLLCCSVLSLNCNSQVTNIHPEKEKIALTAKISLPTVSGRIDHIAFDPEHHLAFISAWGNNSVEVVNIETRQLVHSITDLHEPLRRVEGQASGFDHRAPGELVYRGQAEVRDHQR